MKKKTVLVIDDDHDLRDTMCMALETEGYRVLAAENGKVALDLLQGLSNDHLPDCILLDMMMPEMDGLQFLKLIKHEQAGVLARIPILIATAKGSQSDTSILYPGTRRISKPMELDELFVAVHDLCEGPADATV